MGVFTCSLSTPLSFQTSGYRGCRFLLNGVCSVEEILTFSDLIFASDNLVLWIVSLFYISIFWFSSRTLPCVALLPPAQDTLQGILPHQQHTPTCASTRQHAPAHACPLTESDTFWHHYVTLTSLLHLLTLITKHIQSPIWCIATLPGFEPQTSWLEIRGVTTSLYLLAATELI